MKQFGMRCAVVAAVGFAMVVFSSDSATVANNLADPTVKEIMQQANGKDGLCKAIGAGLKLKDPKWDELEAKAKELAPLAKAMEKNDPPKGDKEEWKKKCAAYAKACDDLATAASAKDGKAAEAAMKTITTSCGGCHMAHRGKK